MRSLVEILHKYYQTILYYFFRGNNLLRIMLHKGHGNVIKVGEGSVLKRCCFIITGGGNKIVIGKNCNLQGVRFFMESDNNSIIINSNVVINASNAQPTLLNACDGRSIEIGESSLLSNSIEMHTTDYHVIQDANGNVENMSDDIFIGNHVWIGLQCILLKGTKVVDDCVVGARSLLTKEYKEKNTIIAGQPAIIIKKNIYWKH